MLLGAIVPRGMFKPADVDVLFPTPISQRLVLGFRMFRDSLSTIVLPLIIAIFAIRPISAGWDAIVKNLPPGSVGQFQRNLWIAWLILSAFTVICGYATGLFFNRPETKYDKLRSRWGWGIAIFVVTFIVSTILIAMQQPNFAAACNFLGSAWVRIPMFIPHAATQMVIAPLSQSISMSIFGYAVLVGSIGVSLMLAMRQAPFLYEQAAARAEFVKTNSAKMQGDVGAAYSQLAKSGKLKVKREGRLSKVIALGPRALIWKNAILYTRTTRAVSLLLPLLLLVPQIAIILSASSSRRSEQLEGVLGYIVLGMSAMLVFIMTMVNTQFSFSEMLKRVDLQKPLPFTPSKIVFYEVWWSALLPAAMSIAATVISVILKPMLWQFGIATILYIPTFALLLCNVSFLATILFPDYDDPTQRSLRGLVMLLAIVLSSAPGSALLIAMLIFKVSPIFACIIPAAINIALALLASTVSGNVYANYNPSE